jgi:hypothetical protein
MKFVGKTNGSFEPRKWQLILAMATLGKAILIEMILIGNLCYRKIEKNCDQFLEKVAQKCPNIYFHPHLI